MIRAAAATLACTLASAAAANAQAPHALAIVAGRSEIAPASKVGNRKTGLLCLPNGRVGWRDAAPRADQVAEAVAEALRSRTVAAAAPGDAWGEATTAPRVLIVSVEALRIDVCEPRSGLARTLSSRRPVKGEGEVTLVWRLHDRRTRAVEASWTRRHAFCFSEDGVPLAEIVATEIGRASANIASEIAARLADPATAR